jgi:hypothetical protein
MTAFLSPLRCEYVPPWEYMNEGWNDNDGTDRWQLTEPFKFHSDVLHKTDEVPFGFRFDKASVPTLPVIYANFGGRYTRAACIHDWLCRMQRVERKKADLVFLEFMRFENSQELQAMYAAGVDDDDIADRKASLEGRAQMMYAAVALYTKTGLWK